MTEDKKAMFKIEIVTLENGEEKFETTLEVKGYKAESAMLFLDVAQNKINAYRQDYLEQVTDGVNISENKGGIQ